MEKDLKEKLVVGAKIKIGEIYAKEHFIVESGEIIELVEGSFDEDNGLYTYTSIAPAIWNEDQKEFESIYHLFGNNLEHFYDCEILITPEKKLTSVEWLLEQLTAIGELKIPKGSNAVTGIINQAKEMEKQQREDNLRDFLSSESDNETFGK